MTMNENQKKMVEQFQCPGCVAGSDTECGKFKPDVAYGATCQGHVIGTSIWGGAGHIALGLPKGFCRSGLDPTHPIGTSNTMNIRLWEKDTKPVWDKFNVAVWAMEHEGHLFVRTFVPRRNWSYVDVIEGGTLALTPHAINVGEFFNDID
jgi:hypothetical protein